MRRSLVSVRDRAKSFRPSIYKVNPALGNDKAELPVTHKSQHNLHQHENKNNGILFSHQLDYYLATSKFGMGMDIANTLVASISCIMYVIVSEANISPSNAIVKDLEIIFGVVFMLDYLIRFVAAKKKMPFILHYMSIIDLLTIIPVFFINYGVSHDMSVMSFMTVIMLLRVLRILRVIRLYRLFAFSDSEIKQQLYSMALTMVCLIYLAAGLLHIVENIRILWPRDLDYKSHDFLEITYLIITTITTVGYGDIVPVTTPGRIVIMTMMITALVLVPRQTNHLIALMAMTSVYGRQSYKYNSHTTHVIVCGAINAGGIMEFFNELFHPDHGNTNLHAVVIGKGLPSNDMQSLLSDPRYAFALTYLDGNVMNERDLRRAAAQHAKGIFMLTNKYSKSVDEDDASVILRVLSVKRFIELETNNDSLFTSVQLLSPDSQKLFTSSVGGKSKKNLNNHIVCVHEIKMNMLAKSTICPGMCTMICNLISSSGDEVAEDGDGTWMNEYIQGLGKEIYRVPLSAAFQGLTFLEAADMVYDVAEIVLFALELNHEVAESRVILNPGSTVIPNVEEYGVFGFVIAEDKDEALLLSSIRSQKEFSGRHDFRKLISHGQATLDIEEDLSNRILVLKQQRRKFSKARNSGKNTGIAAEKPRKGLWANTRDIIRKRMKSKGNTIGLRDLYYLSEKPIPLDEAMLGSIHEAFPEEWGGHIIVIGNPANIYHFILALRSRHLSCSVPIVILHPNIPTTAAWQKMSVFKDVFFIQGSPLEAEDLERAKVSTASRAVIFAKESDDLDESDGALIDADTIFAYSIISKLNDKVEIIGEVVTTSNISFLYDIQKDKQVDYHFSPPFAAGSVYTSSMLDTLVCQAYYNPHITTILHQLVAGGDDEAAYRWNKQMTDVMAPVKDSHFYSIEVPKEFNGRKYSTLFTHLVSNKTIPLGLRRCVRESSETGNCTPYVFTAPPKDCLVYSGDSVFVLAQTAPKFDSATMMLLGTKHKAEEVQSEQSVNHIVQATTEESNRKIQVKEGHAFSFDDDDPIAILNSLSGEVVAQMGNLNKEMQSLVARVAVLEESISQNKGASFNSKKNE